MRKQKLILLGLMIVGVVLIRSADALALTNVTSPILVDETWTLAGSPYIVGSNGVSVGFQPVSGTTLTIEPGVVVKFQGGFNSQFLTGLGKVIANGTVAQPIVFTSIKDDTAGGDTNSDGTSTTPVVGDWYRISLGNDQDSLTHAEVRYANQCLDTFFNKPTIKNNLLHDCNIGIYFVHSTTTSDIIEGNTIRNTGTGLKFLNSPKTLINNNIYNNTFGAENLTPEVVVNATGNWWGHASGPLHAILNPGGTGNPLATTGFSLGTFLSAAYSETPPTPTVPAATGPSSGQRINPVSVRPQIEFRSDKQKIKEGESATLTWEIENAEYVSLLSPPARGGDEEGVGGERSIVPLSGSLTVTPEKTTTYRLVALGPGGEVSSELTIEVLPRDPVVIVPGILGSWGGRLDPILHTYDGLWEGLKSVGYEEGKTLFTFPYDWRKDNRETAGLLAKKIDSILQICGCEKVDVVAHSMGGLVTRYYVQNINDATIDQLIFLGTPHLGAPKAYLAWEAGEMGPGNDDFVIEKVLELEAKAKRYSSVVEYIQREVLSVKQLLPTYEYLKNHSTNELYDYSRCSEGLFPCNDFLDNLNQIKPSNYESLSTFYLINNDNNTFRLFFIEKKDEGYRWQHGKPYNYPKIDGILVGSGDSTVPTNSAEWGADSLILVQSVHYKLPYFSQSAISKILINKEIVDFGRTPVLRKILFIGIKSPADITVIDSNGNSPSGMFYSGTDDPEFITIPDPIDGEYKINVIGTGEGHFEVEATLIGDDLEQTQIYSGEIKTGEEYKFSTVVAADTIQELKMEQAPTPTSTELVIPDLIGNPEELDSGSEAGMTNEKENGNKNFVIARNGSDEAIPSQEDEIATLPSVARNDELGEELDNLGQVQGITITNEEGRQKEIIALLIISSLAILILGYTIVKFRKKNKI